MMITNFFLNSFFWLSELLRNRVVSSVANKKAAGKMIGSRLGQMSNSPFRKKYIQIVKQYRTDPEGSRRLGIPDFKTIGT